MITALIIEDEKMIRNGLLNHIPWQELGVDDVRAGEHAKEVMEICSDFKPDIIVSDIRLPGMDGITLCRKLRERFTESQIIFVTGFSDKEYLKAAIDLHAVSYVEKPVVVSVVTKAVQQAIEQVKKSRSSESVALYSLLMNSSEMNYSLMADKNFCVLLVHLSHVKNPQEIKGLLLKTLALSTKKSGFHFMAELINNSQIAILISTNNKDLEVKFWTKEILKGLTEGITQHDEKWFIAVGKVVNKQRAVNESYLCAEEALKCLSYKGWCKSASMEDVPEVTAKVKVDRLIVDSFIEAIVKKDMNRAIADLETVFQQLTAQRAIMSSDVRYLYYTLRNGVTKANQSYHLGEAKKDIEEGDASYIERVETLQEIHEYMIKQVTEIVGGKEEQRNTYVIKIVSEYILENYKDSNISITEIADYVHLTPTYLSNLFKKNTGVTIGQYLVDVRVEFAKQLLKDPQFKLYQIASLVGYEDANYFARIFKKKTGMNPSEYRENAV